MIHACCHTYARSSCGTHTKHMGITYMNIHEWMVFLTLNHNNIQGLSQARAAWHIRIDHVRRLRCFTHVNLCCHTTVWVSITPPHFCFLIIALGAREHWSQPGPQSLRSWQKQVLPILPTVTFEYKYACYECIYTKRQTCLHAYMQIHMHTCIHTYMQVYANKHPKSF